ncbi:DUF2235 domain-containing protein [Okeanomitos corallinicola TIOX110]|uniref:DUF2235 domain-containing protein n=1 Tax=Okeanomitos corallinicola TIOX110 TaxID=3133117 RepID=A0ABZ2UU84_9CYAN
MKRLVLVCDGTWQKATVNCPTNVMKMAQSIRPFDDDNISQIVYYSDGIGTDYLISEPTNTSLNIDIVQLSSKYLGGSFGWGIDNRILEAYQFLCLNYQKGDQIYLFGFSRGAYTVRSLAGLIYCSGLLKKEFINKITDAYNLYRDPEKKPQDEQCIEFRNNYGTVDYKNRETVPIKVLGCWDTVGSLGFPNLIEDVGLDKLLNKKYGFHDRRINRDIENAFHAVAIDEKRLAFDVTRMELPNNGSNVNIEQVWFPGNHGCVGGGTQETQGLANCALLWMIRRVESLTNSLSLDQDYISKIIPDHSIYFDNTPRSFFFILDQNFRIIDDFSNLHHSVKKRWCDDQDYRPQNLEKFQDQLNDWCQSNRS